MTKETNQHNSNNVQVAVRIRPLTDRDRARSRFANLANDDALKIHSKTIQVVPQNKLFTFDYVFGTDSTQNEIFSVLGNQLIRKFIDGYNITILAYGQTSSGKTYTMGTAFHGHQICSEDEGIIPRSMALLFELLHNNETIRPISPTSSISSSTSSSHSKLLRHKATNNNRSTTTSKSTRFTVKVSFIEIYNEELHDLLNSAPPDELPPITIREDAKNRIYWTGVKEVEVHNTADVMYYLEQGTQNRATGATDMNEKSSRSHAIFSVSLKQEKWVANDITSNTRKMVRPTSSLSSSSSTRLKSSQEDGEWIITTSKFHFVDLAGSERLKRTAAEGDRRREGININAGLLALGNVISALGDLSKKSVHIPFRDSKLTRLLQDSLGGNATTLMIACVSPLESNLPETLNTLQYANRARNIKNRSERNQQEEWMVTDNIELLRSLISKLKTELTNLKRDSLSNKVTTGFLEEEEEEDDDEQRLILISDLQRQIEELEDQVTVTRERNRIVEKELQRLRLVEASANNVDFQHLVEPVIEEYEKSIAKLESQLALTKAALTHSNMGYEEQQGRILQFESTLRQQEQTMNTLQSRLSKVLEREQSNEAYIRELETKLLKSAQETSKDQEMLNDLKLRIMKLKETDENTEQYILGLEQRLATGDKERVQLVASIEDLEAKIESKEQSNLELMKRLSKSTSEEVTEKLILKELDKMNARYNELQQERNELQKKVDQLQQQQELKAQVVEVDSSLPEKVVHQQDLPSEKFIDYVDETQKFKNRKSFADEKETIASITALKLRQTEANLKEESERANRLQLTLDRLQHDHTETIKELDEALQRYHESLEQLEFLEQRTNSSTMTHEDVPAVSIDLNKEMMQAKHEAYEQEKLKFSEQMIELESRIHALTEEIKDKDNQLSVSQDTIRRLEHDLVDSQIEKMHGIDFSQQTEEFLLNQDITHSKLIELQESMKELMFDLNTKENYIAELERNLEETNSHEASLQVQLSESQQQTMSLQKKLDEALASLSDLKVAYDKFEKKVIEEKKNTENERHDLIVKHKAELANIQQSTTSMLTEEITLDQRANIDALQSIWEKRHEDDVKKMQDDHQAAILELNNKLETAYNQIVELQNELKESKLLYENYVIDHEVSTNKLTHELEAAFQQQLKNETLALQTELETAKALHKKLIADHEIEITEISSSFETAVCQLEDEVKEIRHELEVSKTLQKEIDSSHKEKIQAALISEKKKLEQKYTQELQEYEANYTSKLKKLQADLDTLNLENKSLKSMIDTEREASKAKLAAVQSKVMSSPLPSPPQTIRLQSNNNNAYVAEKIALLESQLTVAKLEREQSSQSQQESSGALKKQLKDLEQSLLKEQQKNELLTATISNLEEQGQQSQVLINELRTQYENELENREKIKVLQREKGSDTNIPLQEENKDISLVLSEPKMAEIAHQLDIKNQCIDEQQNQINKITNELEESKQLYNNATVLYKQRVVALEAQIEQVSNENSEYAILSKELEKEIIYLTEEKEKLVDTINNADDKADMDKIKTLLGVKDNAILLRKIEELIAQSFTENDHQSSPLRDAGNNEEEDKNIKIINDLKIELNKYQQRLQELQQKDAMMAKKLEDIQEQQKQEHQRLTQAEQSKKRLEKQVEHLLSKRSSFICF
ncbi:uncharacterized protein BX663DRAFT_523777 [Cokeromyces recurvatus]|uniref:uncharacterized protein n=1 Tax=Cokeromyces recurvatus TaxID=90255 RepID=UPI00221ED01C|nr:uncharacterized protein BX663DRAFT_523777 [Cokeromyces recurvatus]KAI7898697.1 hypothetical protein BX663DRAFT_523777 [Cokeromyces recurvatus]